MYKVVFAEKFQKQLAKLSKANRFVKVQTKKTVELLKFDIKHPSLRLHKLGGGNYWSVSVNKSIRIIARWDEDSLYLLRIGTHEDVY